MLDSEAKSRLQEILDLINLADEVCVAVKQAASFKVEWGELRKRVSQLMERLEILFCSITSFDTAIYLRPVNCVVAKVKANLKHAQATVNKCQHQSLIYRVLFTCSSNATHFRNLFQLLDDSINDMQYLVTIYDLSRKGVDPRFKNSPTFLAWSCIVSVQMGRQLEDRVKAAECLALLAQEKNEYKEIIFEECGVPPLLKFFKESSSLEAQTAASNALCLLANTKERTGIILKEMIPAIVNRLSGTSPVKDQIQAANLVANIAQNINPEAKEYDLIKENVIWRLVTLLSSEDHDPQTSLCRLELKISCSKALLMLALGSVANCRTLTETKGMLCLAKLVETERDELQYNCLMIIREITAIAEYDNDFRHSAFKRTSLAAKAVVDELLRVIKEFDEAKLRIPAIKSIGSLARSFSGKESRVIISPLVAQLDNPDQEITMEAAAALKKFVCTENHVCSEHSKSIIQFNGVPMLMKLLSNGDKMLQLHGLALICYLAKHGGNNHVLFEAGALTALKTTGIVVSSDHHELKELVSDAITKLRSNHTENHEEFDCSAKCSIKQFIREQSKVVTVTDFSRHQSKSLLDINLQVVRTTSEIVKRCEKRLLQAKRWFTFTTRRIKPFLKTQSLELELALRLVVDYPGTRPVVTDIARKLREVTKFVKLFGKKEIRKKFGYIIHKFCKIAVTCKIS